MLTRSRGENGHDEPPAATRAGPGSTGLALAAAALLPIVVLALAFPEGGYEPFAPSAFWPALAGVLLIALLLPPGDAHPARASLQRASAPGCTRSR